MKKNTIKKILSNYKLFAIRQQQEDLLSCVLDERQDSVLLLINPKLVYLLEKLDGNIRSPKVTADTVLLSDIEEMSNEQKHNNHDFNNKFERKNKNNIKLNDDVDNYKTSKIKNKKKNRNKIDLDKDDIFIKNSNLVSNENVESLNLAIMRPVKANKQNKKRLVRKDISNNNKFNKSMGDEKFLNSKNQSINQKPVVKKEIILDSPLTIQQLASKLKVTEASIITWLFLQSISVTINQLVDIAIATKVAKHYDFTIIDSINYNDNLFSRNENTRHELVQGIKRPAIITIFGHVDHGKTTLLDAIRRTHSVHLEAGGITQAITAYEVEWPYMSSIEKLVFLDTPGHEAFTGMRLRSAEVTDLAILLIAADDGLQPQTIEAINHINSCNIPYIIAINKIDKRGVNILKIKQELMQCNAFEKKEEGTSIIVEISALTGQNIDTLLSKICELSQLQELKADPHSLAEGTILEAHLDKKTGPIAAVVIKNGSLHVGDIIVAGNIYGRVKSIVNNLRHKVIKAEPSCIVEMWGFSSVPQAGVKFYCVNNEKEAKQLVLDNLDSSDIHNSSTLLNSRVTLDSYSRNANLKQVNLILKTDTQGSIEAIVHAFFQISQEKVQINIISCSSGSISDTDIDLAITSNSLIIGFNINISNYIYSTGERLNVVISNFNVIYELIDYIKEYMLGLVDPEYKKVSIGQATVQTVFNINKGTVAGCIVDSGKLRKNAHICIYRNNILIYDGLLNSLKRVKDDVDEVSAGNECGVMCLNYNLWNSLDKIEAYELIEKDKLL